MSFRPHRLLCLFLVVCLCSCGRQKPTRPVTATFNTMGTYAAITVPYAERDRLSNCAEIVEKHMGEVNDSLSTFIPGSDVSTISQMAGVKAVAVCDGTYGLLVESKDYGSLSGGAFDVTVTPLLELWGLRGGQPATVPSQQALESALARVGWQHLVLSEGTALLENPGMKLDLGGIAKGYAVDICYEALTACGATNTLVNLGGNIRCSGFSRSGVPWMIGIRHPFGQLDRLVGKIDLTDGMATATSGNYEQFVEIDGERYTHIIDPRTGYPVKGMASVTVICSDALQADAMSTILFVLGVKEGAKLLAGMNDCAALFIPDKRPAELWATSNFLDHFTATEGFKERIFVLDASEAESDDAQP